MHSGLKCLLSFEDLLVTVTQLHSVKLTETHLESLRLTMFHCEYELLISA